MINIVWRFSAKTLAEMKARQRRRDATSARRACFHLSNDKKHVKSGGVSFERFISGLCVMSALRFQNK